MLLKILFIIGCFLTQIGDQTGQVTAQMNLSDLKKVLGVKNTDSDSNSLDSEDTVAKHRQLKGVKMNHVTIFC